MQLRRSPQVQAEYDRVLLERKEKGYGCFMCERVLRYIHMGSIAIVKNDFPYDGYSKHYMFTTVRHAKKPSISEMKELFRCIERVKDNYDHIVWNCPSNQSINDHFHVHLLKK